MTSIDPNAPVRFKIELLVDYDKFVIPQGKSKSMINGMQREQTQFAVEDALKLAGLNPQTLNIYKVRNGS
ncbi:MAG: hypothetical protein ACK5DE_03225 [Bacteroidota bacterium]